MTHGSLFSGIGGFDLAAQRVGFENIFQVEIDKFCQKVLTKNFPNVQKYLDIKDFDGTKYRGEVDIISGGFPCQPFSHAGKRKGDKDERALFPEMLRIIGEAKPKWIVAENVSGILSINDGEYFEEVCSSLESEGYAVQSFIIPACAVNAPHKRDRVWILGYAKHNGCDGTKNGKGGNSRSNSNPQGAAEVCEFARSTISRHTTAAHSDRNDQRNNRREIQSPAKKDEGTLEGENGQRMRSGISTADNNAANTDGKRLQGSGHESGKQKIIKEIGTKFSFHTMPNPDKLNGNDGRFSASEISQHQETEIQGSITPNTNNPATARQRGNGGEILSVTESERFNSDWEEPWYEVATRFCRVDDGVPHRVDRLKGLGNAIVPQIAQIIFETIKNIETL